jgi:serine O-acetyltransferase
MATNDLITGPLPLGEPHDEPVDAVVADVVAELREQADRLATPLRKTSTGQPLPSRDEIILMIELLRSVIFPGFHGVRDLSERSLSFHMGATLDRAAQIMQEEVRRGLCFSCFDQGAGCCVADCELRARSVTTAFLRRLPELRRLLALDAVAAYEGDPAAPTPSEAIFCYPGVAALTSHRVAHELYRLGVPLIPRIISEHAHSLTGIDIHPGASIGEKFFIDHGTGVVIGETTIIGDRVRMYQGVTLGAKSFPLDAEGNPIKGIPRHPVIEDDVTLYSGATILGRVRIGRGSVIGGNVWLTRDVPPGSRIVQARPGPEVFEGGGGI